MTNKITAEELNTLFATIQDRASSKDSASYTRALLKKGSAECARKLGEESLETIIAALANNKKNAIAESADLLYHWLVLMQSLNIAPNEVYAELQRRRLRDEKPAKTPQAPQTS